MKLYKLIYIGAKVIHGNAVTAMFIFLFRNVGAGLFDNRKRGRYHAGIGLYNGPNQGKTGYQQTTTTTKRYSTTATTISRSW